jgi:hypothetical protein
MPGCSDRNLAEILPLKPASSRDEGDRISRRPRNLRVRGRLSGRTHHPQCFDPSSRGLASGRKEPRRSPNDSKGFIVVSLATTPEHEGIGLGREWWS